MINNYHQLWKPCDSIEQRLVTVISRTDASRPIATAQYSTVACKNALKNPLRNGGPYDVNAAGQLLFYNKTFLSYIYVWEFLNLIS
ncbi:hypothetical protein GN956_G6031 [Arapaima gigas]